MEMEDGKKEQETARKEALGSVATRVFMGRKEIGFGKKRRRSATKRKKREKGTAWAGREGRRKNEGRGLPLYCKILGVFVSKPKRDRGE